MDLANCHVECGRGASWEATSDGILRRLRVEVGLERVLRLAWGKPAVSLTPISTALATLALGVVPSFVRVSE